MRGEEEMAGEEQMQKSKACSSLAPNSSFYFDLASPLIERMTLTFEKSGKILLAAVQDTPVNFDLEASISKFQVLTREAGEKARELVKGTKDENCPVTVVFPEAFLSCYPRGYDVSDESLIHFLYQHLQPFFLPLTPSLLLLYLS